MTFYLEMTAEQKQINKEIEGLIEDKKEGTVVNITLDDNKIVIEPVVKAVEYNLEKLLSEVNEDNLHNEYFIDKPKGKEIW